MKLLNRLFGRRPSEQRSTTEAEATRPPSGASQSRGASQTTAWSADLLFTATEPSCNDRVRWVAEVAGFDDVAFGARAASSARHLGAARIEELAGLFHAEHTPPADLTSRFPGLGAWMSARQFAIFEIFFHIGAPALPALRRVAFGQYDWTQGNAIEVLCRLAADGVERTAIVEELKVHLPDIRDEAIQYALAPLLYQQTSNAALREVLSKLRAVPIFSDWYQEIEMARSGGQSTEN